MHTPWWLRHSCNDSQFGKLKLRIYWFYVDKVCCACAELQGAKVPIHVEERLTFWCNFLKGLFNNIIHMKKLDSIRMHSFPAYPSRPTSTFGDNIVSLNIATEQPWGFGKNLKLYQGEIINERGSCLERYWMTTDLRGSRPNGEAHGNF